MIKNTKKEPAQAKKALLDYCALGPERDLTIFASTYKNPAAIRRWSKEYGWPTRVKEYDAQRKQEARDKKARERLEAIDEMNTRQADTAKEAQELALEQIRYLKDKGKLNAIAAIQLLKIAIEAERKARDIADQKIEISGKDGEPIQIITTWGTPKVGKREE